MGLDNGFVVRGVTRNQLPRGIRFPSTNDYIQNEVEVAYFRRYWGFRNTYLSMISSEIYPEQYEFELTRDQVKDAINCLDYFLKNNPHDADNGYWEDSTVKHIKVQKHNLILLWRWMKHHPNYTVTFYDSY